MKVRALLAAGAAAAALIGTGVGAGVAAAAPVSNTSATTHAPGFGGVAKPSDAHAAPLRSAAASCSEPNCNMSYHGGYVQHHPHVYLVFWGSKWNTRSTAYKLLTGYFRGLGTSRDGWSRITRQYHDKSGRPMFTGRVLLRTVIDHRGRPNVVHWGQFNNEAVKIYRQLHIRDKGDAEILIVSQSGTCFDQRTMGGLFAGNCGNQHKHANYCGWHSYTNSGIGGIPVINLPYQLNAGPYCGRNFINRGTRGAYDGFTLVGGHEYTETLTDPHLNAWLDPRDSVSGGEIADKCAWRHPDGNIHLGTGSFAIQSLWSNSARRCVL